MTWQSFITTILFKMRLASLAKNVLLLFRYPRYPPLPQDIVGSVRVRIPEAPACQVFYPASQTTRQPRKSNKNEFHPYFRPEAVEGLADYLGVSKKFLKLLSDRKHPCEVEASPKKKTASTTADSRNNGNPIVVFSHGLGGCMEMYTHLCSNIASLGFIVVALEHEDGSGCYAETVNGKSIFYKRPDDTPYSRQKVLKLRTPMLDKRVGEVQRVIDYLLGEKSPPSPSSLVAANRDTRNTTTNTERGKSLLLLETLLMEADKDMGVALIGHSFGASTMTLVAQHFASSASSLSTIQKSVINSVSLLDPWSFSLPDTTLQKGIQSVPVLSILSESWTTNKETRQVITLLKNSNVTKSLWVKGTVHQSFCDSGSWIPGVIAKKMWMRGKNEPIYETDHLVALQFANHVRQSSISSNYSKVPMPQVMNITKGRPSPLYPYTEDMFKLLR